MRKKIISITAICIVLFSGPAYAGPEKSIHNLRKPLALPVDERRVTEIRKKVSSQEAAIARRQLIKTGQIYVDLLSSRGAALKRRPDVYLAVGNPFISPYIRLVEHWRAQSGQIPIIVSGGRHGKGRNSLLERVRSKYGSGQGNFKEDTTETDLLNFILTKENLPEDVILSESYPSNNTAENIRYNKALVEKVVNGIDSPRIALISSQTHSLRLKATAEVEWHREIDELGWQVSPLSLCRIDLNLLSDAKLIELFGIIAGYPKGYAMQYGLNTASELQGFYDTMSRIGLDRREQGQLDLLQAVRDAFEEFLKTRELVYDIYGQRLVPAASAQEILPVPVRLTDTEISRNSI